MTSWQETIDAATSEIGRRSSTPVNGCDEDELQRLQRDQGVRLPDAYLRFLRRCGEDPGDFLRGSDLRLDLLPSMRGEAVALLDDLQGPSLPQDTFVFCSHQGYQFLFFYLGEQDPEIWHYLEGEREHMVVSPAFSLWLRDTVQTEFGG